MADPRLADYRVDPFRLIIDIYSPEALASGELFMVLKMRRGFCVFYTEKQSFFWKDTQFCNLTKIVIEILLSFVYNVFIVGRTSAPKQREEISFPKGE